MNILVTGALGATGRVLCSFLINSINKKVYLTDRKETDLLNYYYCDLSKRNMVTDLLKKLKPNQLYHLAGTFSNDLEIDLASNVLATANLLQASLDLNLNIRLLLVGSAAEYGIIREEENPVEETHPLRPCSIYGLTKAYQKKLMDYYVYNHKMNILMVRPFNLIGEGVSEKLFIGRLMTQIEKYKKGEIDKITVGNLQNRRDYIHIEDAVKDFVLVMNKGEVGEVYNIGSGSSKTIRSILEKILSDNGLDMNVVQELEYTKMNAFDIKDIYAKINKINKLKKSQ